jgi:hypothetical protein
MAENPEESKTTGLQSPQVVRRILRISEGDKASNYRSGINVLIFTVPFYQFVLEEAWI